MLWPKRAVLLVGLLASLAVVPDAKGGGAGTPLPQPFTFETLIEGAEVDVLEAQNRRLSAKLKKLNRKVAKLEKALDRKRFEQACKRPKNIVTLGRCLQADGFRVSEHPAFGGVDPVHSSVSLHYPPCSCAIDVNWTGGDEMAKLDALYPRLAAIPGVEQLLWRVSGHYDHLHVAFP